VLAREVGSDYAAHAVADDDRSLEAGFPDQPGDVVDEAADRVVLVRLIGRAVAAQVHRHNPVREPELAGLVSPV